MEITGKIIIDLQEQSGVSKAGNNWKKHEYVLETQETYPRKVKFDFFGDKADQYKLSVGKVYTVSFDIDSREYNGRWYTEARAWKAEEAQGANASVANPVPPMAQQAPVEAPVPPAPGAAGASDDLPF